MNMEQRRRKIIVVTDGDQVAREALEKVAKQIQGRVISLSAGNPTLLSGPQLVRLIHRAKYDPVIVMFDDCGNSKEGYGEKALRYVANHQSIEVIGAIAVASNCLKSRGTPVHMALDYQGNVISHSVDKYGRPQYHEEMRIYGDTVEVLNAIQIPIIIGIGDVGKMRRYDYYKIGAPVTTKAIQLLLDIHKKNSGTDKIKRYKKAQLDQTVSLHVPVKLNPIHSHWNFAKNASNRVLSHKAMKKPIIQGNGVSIQELIQAKQNQKSKKLSEKKNVQS